MALTKITSAIIADGAITASAITDTSITADKLAATLDLTGKTITVATATAGDNDTTVASTAFVSTAIANLADSAPETLNTLNELAAALGDDANFSTTVTNSIALKAPLASPTFTGTLTASGLAYPTSDGTNGQVLTTDGSGTLSFADAAGGVDGIVSSANATAITIDSSENVGIGVTPSSGAGILQIQAAKTFTVGIPQGNLVIADSTAQATGVGGAINFTGKYLDNGTITSFASIEASKDNGTSGHHGAALVFKTRENGGSQNEGMRIDSSGNVGIGTDSPAAVLHISGDVGNTELEALRLSNFDPDKINGPAGHAVSLSFELPANDGGNTDGKLAAKIVGLAGANGGNDWYTGSPSTNFQGQLDFYTRNDDVLTNQMTIDEHGYVGLATTNPNSKLEIFDATGGAGTGLRLNCNNGGSDIWDLYSTTAGRLYITNPNYSGGVYLQHSATSWTSASDERLKENIVELDNVLPKISNLRAVKYNFISDEEDTTKIGFIAQDWQTDFSEVVNDIIPEELGMNYTETIPVLLKAIQELKTELDAAKARIEILENP